MDRAERLARCRCPAGHYGVGAPLQGPRRRARGHGVGGVLQPRRQTGLATAGRASGVRRGGNRSTFKVWEEGKAPDFVLEVASPSTADNDAGDKARKYAGLGVREYWRLDPEGTIMGAPLEGYRARWGRFKGVESIQGAGGVGYLRSGVLGLNLRTHWRNGAMALVIRNPLTGEEFDGALEESERQRRLAEERTRAAENRAIAAEEQLTAARDDASAAKERIRSLEQRLRDLSGQTRPMGRGC